MEVCRLRRSISIPPSRSRGLERRAAALQFSGARGVSCCSPTSFSSARVSAPFTPHTSTPVPLPCAHQCAEIRSGLTFCHKRSVCALVSLPQEQNDARGVGKVKRQTARRHRINIYDQIPRGLRGSRGRRGAQDASDDSTPLRTRLWAGVAATSLRDSRGLAAASGAASAAPPSVAPGGAAQLAPERCRQRQHAPTRSHPVGPPRTVWRTSKAASGAPRVLYVRLL
jgi:hypothetical protein